MCGIRIGRTQCEPGQLRFHVRANMLSWILNTDSFLERYKGQRVFIVGEAASIMAYKLRQIQLVGGKVNWKEWHSQRPGPQVNHNSETRIQWTPSSQLFLVPCSIRVPPDWACWGPQCPSLTRLAPLDPNRRDPTGFIIEWVKLPSPGFRDCAYFKKWLN